MTAAQALLLAAALRDKSPDDEEKKQKSIGPRLPKRLLKQIAGVS